MKCNYCNVKTTRSVETYTGGFTPICDDCADKAVFCTHCNVPVRPSDLAEFDGKMIPDCSNCELGEIVIKRQYLLSEQEIANLKKDAALKREDECHKNCLLALADLAKFHSNLSFAYDRILIGDIELKEEFAYADLLLLREASDIVTKKSYSNKENDGKSRKLLLKIIPKVSNAAFVEILAKLVNSAYPVRSSS